MSISVAAFPSPATPTEATDAATCSLLRIFVRDLVLPASIGVYDAEKLARQRVRFNVTVETAEIDDSHGDCIDNVISYETIVNAIRDLLDEGHFELVETLADRICAFCLDDSRVHMVQVRVEKLDIISEATAVGVERQKWRPSRLPLSAGKGHPAPLP